MYQPKPGSEQYKKITAMQEFLDSVNLEHRTSNNGVHIIVDIENEVLNEEETKKVRLNIWPTSELLHIVRKGKAIRRIRETKNIHGEIIKLAREKET